MGKVYVEPASYFTPSMRKILEAGEKAEKNAEKKKAKNAAQKPAEKKNAKK